MNQDKTYVRLKIASCILAIIGFSIACVLIVFMFFVKEEDSPLLLLNIMQDTIFIVLGVQCLILPRIADKKSFSHNKGKKLMYVIGILLMVYGLLFLMIHLFTQ